MQTQWRANRGADRSHLGRPCDLLELRGKVLHVGLAQIRPKQALFGRRARQHGVAGDLRPQRFETRVGLCDLRFGGCFRQLDHHLFQLDEIGRGAIALVAHVQDVDPALDGDGA